MPSGNAFEKESYDLVNNDLLTDAGDNDDMLFTEEMHYRSSMLVASRALNLADDMAPTDAQEGMLGSVESMEIYKSLTNVNSISAGSLHRPYQQQHVDRNSDVYLEAQKDVIRRTLEEVDNVANKRIRDGFSEIKFTVGVLNLILVCFAFALYPQHFWLLFLVEGVLFVGTKAVSFWKSRPLNNILFLLDYCWVMNILAIAALIFFLVDGWLSNPVGKEFHRQVFLASLGSANGPLLGACIILPFVCCLFHSLETLADLFIHIFPPMVAYTMKWHSDEIKDAWPNTFFLDYAQEITFFPSPTNRFFESVVGSTIILYLIWFGLYATWMVFIGIDLPRNDLTKSDGRAIVPKYDTVFHGLMRGGLYIVIGSTVFGRSKAVSVEHMDKNNFCKGDLSVYLGAHAFLSILATILLGYPCFHSQGMHASLLMLVTVLAVYRGAERYTYYATEMYGKTLRRQFSHLLEESR